MNTSLKALLAITFTAAVSFATHYSYAQSLTEAPQKQLTSSAATQAKGAEHKIQVVSLNKSTLEQLTTLKGVGQKKAQAIITYRKQTGKFKSVDDLLNVKGIGAKVIADNKSRLKV
ncbi:hypothetical protein GCM10009111_28500 [Colwellia asteriadis]|uniref:Helix-hairpin-helix DNA-binding motif class 1 domain-containing protein n=1 Tax=Colwellia asteriadis TaxID=517723 RepID=A0ABN1LA79_9GAMM